MPGFEIYDWRTDLGAGVQGWQGRTTQIPHGSTGVPTPGPRFPGDPGDGKYMIGVALGPYGNGSLADASGNTHYQGDAKTSVVHTYAGDANLSGSLMDTILARNMIPSQVFRLPGGCSTDAQHSTKMQAILNGNHDANIDNCIATCLARAPRAIWLCFYHEPRSEFTSSGSQDLYRRAYRYIVFRFRAAGVTNVAFMPISEGTNTYYSDNPLKWHPDWNGTTLTAAGWYDELTMDMCGVDTYNPLPVDDNADGKAFSQMFLRVKQKMDKPGYPVYDYVMPEYGMSNRMTSYRPAPGMTNWTQWGQDAIDTAVDERIKAFIYWDNSAEIGRYTFGPRPPDVPLSASSPAGSYDTLMNKKLGWDLITNNSARVRVTN